MFWLEFNGTHAHPGEGVRLWLRRGSFPRGEEPLGGPVQVTAYGPRGQRERVATVAGALVGEVLWTPQEEGPWLVLARAGDAETALTCVPVGHHHQAQPVWSGLPLEAVMAGPLVQPQDGFSWRRGEVLHLLVTAAGRPLPQAAVRLLGEGPGGAVDETYRSDDQGRLAIPLGFSGRGLALAAAGGKPGSFYFLSLK